VVAGLRDRADGRPLVVHVITDAGPHPYFRTLIEAGGYGRSRLVVGCVGASGPLQRDMEQLGVATFALGATSRRQYPQATVRLARLLRASNASVVQTHLVDGCLVGLLAARRARTPLAVMTAHHSHELPFHGRRLVWADRLSSGPLSDHVIAPSHQVAETLTRIAHAAPEKIEVVHHGFDLARLDPANVDRMAVRQALGLDGKLVLGAIGRLYPLKNYAALVEAFAATVAKAPDARLAIVGDGDSGQLVASAKALGIADRVLVLGRRADVPELLAAFDAFVHPAVAESFGMVIVEAMAMAKPVLSTPVGIAPEVIESGSNGLLTLGAGCDALAAGLRELLAVRPRWQEIGTAARSAVELFTATRMAARYEDLYNRWLPSLAS
jgi:glycosyltransferase involved in cell wall biosynthesis